MDATDRRVVGEEKANIDQLPDPDHLASHEMWLCIMASSRGVFLGIRGGGVPPGTPDPDLISQPRPQGAFPGFGGGKAGEKRPGDKVAYFRPKNCHYALPFLDLASKIHILFQT